MSHNTALKVAVVIRCADVVAKTMASLGCHLYKETTSGKERAKAHQLYKLLRLLPNPETTAYEFWHMYLFNLMLTKGAYAWIQRDGNGYITGLWNIPTNKVVTGRNAQTGERFIDVNMGSGKTARYYPGEYMYTPGLRFQDEDDPHDFIAIAGEVLGLTISLNSYAKNYFDNGTNLGGFIEYPGAINEQSFKRFRDDWEKTYKGVANASKWAILEGGFKLTPFNGNDPEKSQALESRKFAIQEVCRIMGVTPHKVFDLDRATFNNIEHLNIEYVQETIDPMDERLSQTIYKDLLTTLEQRRYYARFNVNKLLKGDIATRTAYYHNARQDGWLSANDIRDLEEMNRIPDELGGDIYAINGNMIPINAIPLNLPKGAQKGGLNTGQGNQNNTGGAGVEGGAGDQ